MTESSPQIVEGKCPSAIHCPKCHSVGQEIEGTCCSSLSENDALDFCADYQCLNCGVKWTRRWRVYLSTQNR